MVVVVKRVELLAAAPVAVGVLSAGHMALALLIMMFALALAVAITVIRMEG